MSQTNPNSLANLRPRKKGDPALPGAGRKSKADSILECIEVELGKQSINPELTNAELIGAMLVKMASQGNIRATELMMTFLHTKPNVGLDVKAVTELLVKWDGNRNLPGSAPEITASETS